MRQKFKTLRESRARARNEVFIIILIIFYVLCLILSFSEARLIFLNIGESNQVNYRKRNNYYYYYRKKD